MAPDARRRPSWIGGALLLVAGSASMARPGLVHALSVDKAVVKFNPKKGDGFVLKGRLAGLALEGAASVGVVFGSFGEEVPQASFVARGQKLVYKGPKAPGLRTLVVDRAGGRFLAVGKGIVLAPFHNPVAVRLSADASSECAMIRLAEAGRRWSLAGVAGGGACALESPPGLMPSGFLVQRDTAVRVIASVSPGTTLDGGTAALVRVDSLLSPSGAPVCTLLDDGGVANGDDVAGDGFYGCIASFNEPAPTRIRLLVQAAVGGATVQSPSATLDVATPLTDEEINVGIAAQEMAVTAWDESLAALGDTRQARRATVARIRKIPGVADAAVTVDGYSIWIRYDSGVEGGLNLDPAGTPAAEPAPASPTALGGARSAPRAIRPAALPTVPPRIGNNKVLVWDPWVDETNPELPLLQTLARSSCPPLEVTYLRNEECTIDSLRTFSNYGTVIILTHGAVLPDRSVAFLSREKAGFFGEWFTHAEDLKLGRLLVNNSPRSPDKRGYLVFRPSFLASVPGRFPDSLIFAGACLSANNRTMAEVLFARGAKAFFGMTKTTFTTFSRITADQVFGSLISGGSASDALANVSHRTDRSLIDALQLPFKPLDTELKLFGGDARLAYACGPTTEELLDTLTVAVYGDGQVGTAVLRSDVSYRLVVTGTATESLEQGTNQFDAFYCFGGFCSVGPFGDSRLIGVGVFGDPGDGDPHTALADAIEGDYPAFQASHRYEVTYRPPLTGRLTVTSPHAPSQGPFNTSGSFTIEVYGPR